MASEILLHSGEFLDHDDNMVKVTFYKRTDLNADPSSFHFGVYGDRVRLKIWSRVGSARLSDMGFGDWLDYQSVGSWPIPGSDYYYYVYDIVCSANQTGEDRNETLRVYIEAGQGVGEYIEIPVLQDGAENLVVSPNSITWLPSGGTTGLVATWNYGGEPEFVLVYVQGEAGWLTAHQPNVTDGRKEQTWTASANNTGSSRTAKINVYQGGVIEKVIGLSQSSQ